MPDNISKYNNSLTAQERRARTHKAGIISGEIRRENKQLKDLLRDRLTDDDLNEIVDNLIERAKHSRRDFIALRDTIGEKPTNSVAIDSEPVTIRVHVADD